MKHGLFSAQAVIREGRHSENPEEFQKLLEDVCVALSPSTAYERLKVEQVAVLEWRRRRALKAERLDFQKSDLPFPFMYGRATIFDAHESHLGGAMRRLLDELEVLRSLRPAGGQRRP